MPSLYRGIIRGEISEETKLISSPKIEELYNKKFEEIQKKNKENSVDVSKVQDEGEEILESFRLQGVEILESLKKQGEEFLKESKEKAAEILESSKEEGYQIGYKSGYKDGYSYGEGEAKTEYESLIKEGKEKRESAKKYLETCYEESREYILDVKNEILDIVMEISRKVICTEILQNKESVLSLIESSLLRCADKKQVIIKLSDKNSKIAKMEKERFYSVLGEGCNILILSDSEVDDYTFKLETPSGFIDSTIDSQLSLILKALLGEDLQCTN